MYKNVCDTLQSNVYLIPRQQEFHLYPVTYYITNFTCIWRIIDGVHLLCEVLWCTKCNCLHQISLLNELRFFIPITGTSSAFDLLRDKIWKVFDQKDWSLYSQKSDI